MRLARRFLESADVVAVRGLLARSYVAGRDGSLTILRNTTLTCPVDGMVKSATGASAVPLTSANACTAQISRDGISLPFVGVFGARTNLWPRSTPSGAALGRIGSGGSVGTGYTAEVPDGCTCDVVAFDADSWTLEFNGTVSAVSPNKAGLSSTLRTGSGTVIAGASCTAAATVEVISGAASNAYRRVVLIEYDSAATYLRESETVVTANGRIARTETVGASCARAAMSVLIGNYGVVVGDTFTNYRVKISRLQIETAAFASPYIPTAGAAVTRDADVVTWTPPVALSATSGEVWACEAPYQWSAGAGAAHPSGFAARIYSAGTDADRMYRDTNDRVDKNDAGGQAVAVGAAADAHGVLRCVSSAWGAAELALYQGASKVASDTTLSPPWIARTTVVAGGAQGVANREWYGLISLIYTPGGLTDYERAALARFASGRVIVYAT